MLQYTIKAYAREYPHKILPYMVQYLQYSTMGDDIFDGLGLQQWCCESAWAPRGRESVKGAHSKQQEIYNIVIASLHNINNSIYVYIIIYYLEHRMTIFLVVWPNTTSKFGEITFFLVICPYLAVFGDKWHVWRILINIGNKWKIWKYIEKLQDCTILKTSGKILEKYSCHD